jgi:heme transporter
MARDGGGPVSSVPGGPSAALARVPFMARRRGWVLVAWLVLAALAAPFALHVTQHLTSSGLTAPNSSASWADSQSALLRAPSQPPPTLAQGITLARARSLARAQGVPESAVHAVSGGGVLFLLPSASADRGPPLLAALRGAGAHMTTLDPATYGQAINTDSKVTLQHATMLALPILLVLLFLVFGSVGSAVLPLIVALFGAELSLGVIDILERHITLSVYLTDIATFLALGVGVDYALFISSRFRQALVARRGEPVGHAVGEAMATAGRSVLFSGLAVALALSSLALGDSAYWRGLAVGGAVAVLSVLLATHTLLPALLATMGQGVEWGRLRLGRRRRESAPPDGRGAPAAGAAAGPVWRSLARWATRAPALSSAIGVVLLLVPAYFAPQLSLTVPANLASMLPSTSALRQASNLQQRLQGPGEASPIVVAVRLPMAVTTTAAWQVAARLTARLQAMPDVASVASPTSAGVPPAELAALASALARAPATAPAQAQALTAFVTPKSAPNLLVLFAVARTGPDEPATRNLVRALPAVVARAVPPGSRTGIGGTVALLDQFDRYTQGRLPWIIGGVAAAAAVVLFLATGSLLQALLGVVLDALVALATAGILVLTVQRGGLGLLPASPNLTVTPLVFVLLFGLSMDYEVILLHRIQEALRGGRAVGEAAREGVLLTGGMITGAGLIMVTVFLVMLTSPLEILKTLGIGMSAAILLDTWIVRTFLVPGITTLLGRYAFWPWRAGGRAAEPPYEAVSGS